MMKFDVLLLMGRCSSRISAGCLGLLDYYRMEYAWLWKML